jgi:hypothetical protein
MTLMPLHVIGGAIGLVSGLLALFALKGAGLHRKSGTVFAVAMLVMSVSGAVIAIGRPAALMNLPAALVTAYLVVTSLLTVRRRSPWSHRAERAAMLTAFVLALGSIVSALVSAGRGSNGFVFPLLLFAGLALSAGIGDRRMIKAGGLQGAPRLKRHLWRMCTALFIAAGSFFLGPVGRIPEPLRLPPFRLIPLVVLAVMVYWLWRLRRRATSRDVVRGAVPPASPAPRVAA